ncbi:MAG: AraC family transcriptional regulator [Thermonemataceae bacterium]|nr:AraC family transcriptional regulator [Thermonemataceae bacterium]
MKKVQELIQRAHQEKHIQTLIENRRSYSSDYSELNVYETFTPAWAVDLSFSHPVLVSMIQGKKVMSLAKQSNFDFLPGESILLSPHEQMHIDFPEAKFETPTRCLALVISADIIQKTLTFLNEEHPKLLRTDEWNVENKSYFHIHDNFFDLSIHRIVQLFLEDNNNKDALITLGLKEIVIRLLRTEARSNLLKHSDNYKDKHPLAAVAHYIKENLSQDISIKDLCKISGLCQANLFKYFKNEFGLSPIEYLLCARISKAKKIIDQDNKTIKDACYETGFNSVSYFTKAFKKIVGLAPKQYKNLQVSTKIPS